MASSLLPVIDDTDTLTGFYVELDDDSDIQELMADLDAIEAEIYDFGEIMFDNADVDSDATTLIQDFWKFLGF